MGLKKTHPGGYFTPGADKLIIKCKGKKMRKDVEIAGVTIGSDTSDATITPGTVLEGYRGYNAVGAVDGEIPVSGGVAINPSESAHAAGVTGKYMSGDVTVNPISSTYIGSGISRQAAKTITPSESAQSAGVSGKYMEGDVSVAAIPSTYVGSAITRMSGSTVSPGSASKTLAVAGKYMTSDIVISAIPSNYVDLSSGSVAFSNGAWVGACSGGTLERWTSYTNFSVGTTPSFKDVTGNTSYMHLAIVNGNIQCSSGIIRTSPAMFITAKTINFTKIKTIKIDCVDTTQGIIEVVLFDTSKKSVFYGIFNPASTDSLKTKSFDVTTISGHCFMLISMRVQVSNGYTPKISKITFLG